MTRPVCIFMSTGSSVHHIGVLNVFCNVILGARSFARVNLDPRTLPRGPKLARVFGIFWVFCSVLAAFFLISANID